MTKPLCKEAGERRRGDPQKIFMTNFADCPILGTVSLLFFPCTVPLTFRNHQQGCRVSCRSSFCMPNTVSFGPPALPLLFCRPVVYLFVFFCVCRRYRLIAPFVVSRCPERRVLRTHPRRFRRGGLSLDSFIFLFVFPFPFLFLI